jgi:uncharacterized membrane protein
MSNPASFFTKEQKELILNAIKTAELDTSGEIRLHVESRCGEDVLDRAAYWFAELKMHKTDLRNGVLFYLATSDKKFAILGDMGINAKVPDGFWNEVKDAMIEYFKDNDFTLGLEKGILMAGEKLKEYFPYQKNDVNELDDEISFGK